MNLKTACNRRRGFQGHVGWSESGTDIGPLRATDRRGGDGPAWARRARRPSQAFTPTNTPPPGSGAHGPLLLR